MRGGGHGRARIAALAALAALALVLAACGPEAEPRFTARCAPAVGMEEVTCTIENHGTAAGRACVTARVQPEEGPPLIARRMCTSMLEPGRSIEVKPRFEQLESVRRDRTLASRCLRGQRWVCPVDVVEQTSRAMAENVPPAP